MKKSNLLILIGIVLIAAGSIVTQIAAQTPPKKLRYNNVVLTATNATLNIDLGLLQEGSRVELTWALSHVPESGVGLTVMVISQDTKVPLVEETRSTTVIKERESPFGKGFTWHITGTSNYIMTVGYYAPTGIESVSILFFEVAIYFPVELRYQTYGYSILAIGVIVTGIGLINRKRFAS